MLVTRSFRRRARNFLMALAGLALMASPLPSSANSGANSGADAGEPSGALITEWSELGSQNGAEASTHPLRVAIVLAMVHLAMYDAVNAITGGHEPYASMPATNPGASAEAAAARAAYEILRREYPSREAQLTSAYHSSLETIAASETAKADGVSVGAAAADAIWHARLNDGRNATTSHTTGTGPGSWTPTPPGFFPPALPSLAHVTPFTMESPAQFRTAGPPDLSSDEWAANYNEVKVLGCTDCDARTPEQTATARFWSAPSNVILPPSIRRTSAEHDLGLVDAARMQAMAFTAQADALIATWDGKYHFDLWRPVTAIRAGDTDGNDATAPDPAWTPLLVTPNHPEYPAAHAQISAAVISAMAAFFGGERFHYAIVNPNTGQARDYSHAIAGELEVSDARVWAGIHYRVSVTHGRNAGRAIARNLAAIYFRSMP